jgi:hypothetical protein
MTTEKSEHEPRLLGCVYCGLTLKEGDLHHCKSMETGKMEPRAATLGDGLFVSRDHDDSSTIYDIPSSLALTPAY